MGEKKKVLARIAALASVVGVVVALGFVIVPQAKGEGVAVPGVVSITTPSPLSECSEKLADYERAYKLPMRELINLDDFIQVSFETETGSITLTCSGINDTLTIDIVTD